jgi:hypothetical protein
MNATSWLAQHEKEVMARIAKEMEYMLMFGHSPFDQKRKTALEVTHDLWRQGKITLEESMNLSKMINSSALDNLDFAITLIDTIKNKSTQIPTQDVSNISSPEPQVPESRP